jgi:hypothetical protein
MSRDICPERSTAYRFICRLERAGLKGTRLHRMLANELDRDLLTAESRLHLAIPKAEALMAMLEGAGRSKARRLAAVEAIRASKARVR